MNNLLIIFERTDITLLKVRFVISEYPKPLLPALVVIFNRVSVTRVSVTRVCALHISLGFVVTVVSQTRLLAVLT